MKKVIIIILIGIFNLKGYAIQETLAKKYKMFEPEIEYGREITFETKEERYMSLNAAFTLNIFRTKRNTPSFSADITRAIIYKYHEKRYILKKGESVYQVIMDKNGIKTIFIQPSPNSGTIFQICLTEKISLNRIQEIENYLSIILNTTDYKIVNDAINIFYKKGF